MSLLMRHEVVERLQSQAQFFSTARPDQPVLMPGKADINALRSAIRDIWKVNGWPGFTKAWMPPVRQIAEKHHIDLLTTLYDYIYRLTSGMVHLNPKFYCEAAGETCQMSIFHPRISIRTIGYSRGHTVCYFFVCTLSCLVLSFALEQVCEK